MTSTTGLLPERVLIDGTYFWEQLSLENMTFQLSRVDCESVLEAIISKFISVNDPELTDYHVEVPDFNRMRDTSIKDNPDKLQHLMLAIRNIEQHLYVIFTELGIFDVDNQFSYMFDRLLGKTIVIFKLPH